MKTKCICPNCKQEVEIEIPFYQLENSKHIQTLELQVKELKRALETKEKDIEQLNKKSSSTINIFRGDAQEIKIVELLRDNFIEDKIENISKQNQGGADIMHTVINERKECGKILIESKRTDRFLNSWIAKLKKDVNDSNCDIPIIVTQTLPKIMQDQKSTIMLIDGVWVSDFFSIGMLIRILRQNLIEINDLKELNNNDFSVRTQLLEYMKSEHYQNNFTRLFDLCQELQATNNKHKKSFLAGFSKKEKIIDDMISSISLVEGRINLILEYKNQSKILFKALP